MIWFCFALFRHFYSCRLLQSVGENRGFDVICTKRCSLPRNRKKIRWIHNKRIAKSWYLYLCWLTGTVEYMNRRHGNTECVMVTNLFRDGTLLFPAVRINGWFIFIFLIKNDQFFDRKKNRWSFWSLLHSGELILLKMNSRKSILSILIFFLSLSFPEKVIKWNSRFWI